MVAARSVRDHRLQLLDHAGLNEDAGLIGRDRRIEHLGEYLAFQVRQTTRAVCLFGLYAATGCWRDAALRITLNQCNKAIVGQLLMLGTQAPACRRMLLHTRAQALVQQDGAGVEGHASD